MKSLLAVTLFSAALAGAETAPSATAILDQAKTQAAPDHRVVFLMFHASW